MRTRVNTSSKRAAGDAVDSATSEHRRPSNPMKTTARQQQQQQ